MIQGIAPLTIQQVKKPFITTCVSIIQLVELVRPTGRCRGEVHLAGLGPDAVTQTGDGLHAGPLAVPV